MKIYAVMASANKGQHWYFCFNGNGMLAHEMRKVALDLAEQKYQEMKRLGHKIPRRYFKIVELNERENPVKIVKQFETKIENLQKQLDSKCDRCIERDKKAIAKEILDEVSKHYGGAWIVEFYNKYGVDV